MKNLILALALLIPAPAFAASPAHLSVSVTPSTGITEANIYYPGGVLAERLFDALAKSSEMEEVKNQWIPAGTVFKSKTPGITISRDRTGVVELGFTLDRADEGNLSSGTNALILRYTSERSVARLLQKALLASSSRHVLTRANPGEVIKPRGDGAVVLSNISFSGQYVSCSGNEFSPGKGHCSLTLDRQ